MPFEFEVSYLKGWTCHVTRETKLGVLWEGHAHQLILTITHSNGEGFRVHGAWWVMGWDVGSGFSEGCWMSSGFWIGGCWRPHWDGGQARRSCCGSRARSLGLWFLRVCGTRHTELAVWEAICWKKLSLTGQPQGWYHPSASVSGWKRSRWWDWPN